MMRRLCDAMNRAMDHADERLRGALLGAPHRLVLLALDVLVILAFAALMMTRSMAQLEGAGASSCAATVALLCLPLAVMLFFAGRVGRSRGDSLLAHVLLGGVCAAAMLARVSFLDHVSSDYEIYLSDWMAQFAQRSFREGMETNIGEYNVLYQYILFLLTRLPVPALYGVKAATFMGDAFLAGAAANLAGKAGKKSAGALCLVLLLPACVVNGGMFAQCDSLYAACALWGLAHALGGRRAAGAACFALSLAFKLQAMFLLPIVAVLWAGRKLRLADALVFVLTLLACALPALLGGKSAGQILAIYMGQTGLYTGLTYNAPTLFGLMNTNGLDAFAYGNFGMALALGAVCALLAVYIPRAKRMTDGEYLRAALLMVLLVVFLLPRMHERYFFMADILAAALAARHRQAALPCALIALASLSRYWDLGMGLPVASMLMLLALVLTVCLGKGSCEKDNACV